MSLRADTTDAPDVEIDSIRYLHRPGAKCGTVSIVVGGVHHLFPCKLGKAASFVEGVMEAVKTRAD